MKRKITYTDGPIGELKVIEDFLPPPDQLVKKKKQIKVTIELDEDVVRFFKKQAKKNNTKYQRMIRNLLRFYASHF